MTSEPFCAEPPPEQSGGARPGSHCFCGRPSPCRVHTLVSTPYRVSERDALAIADQHDLQVNFK